MERDEHLWNMLNSVAQWTQFADAKAVAALTADFVIVAALTQTVFDDTGAQSWPVLVAAATAVLVATASGLFAFLTVMPKFSGPPPGAVFFFGSVAEYGTSAEYKAAAAAIFADDVKLVDSLYDMIWSISRRCRHKYENVRWAIRLLLAASAISLLPLFFGA